MILHNQQIFITGIHTDAGKTFTSTVLLAGLEWNYWKPIQSGASEGTDAQTIQQALAYPKEKILAEKYILQAPLSPHEAAFLENVEIQASELVLPTVKPLLIEGAGGLMVPLNPNFLIIDLIKQWSIPTILVIRPYLGAINHSLLSIEALQKRNIPILGVIFCLETQPETEKIILSYSGLSCLGKIPILNCQKPADYKQAFEKYISLPFS